MTYYFSTAQVPLQHTSVYGSSDMFALAMFQQSSPTLLAYGGTFAKNADIKLKIYCHLHFLLVLEDPQWNEEWTFPLSYADVMETSGNEWQDDNAVPKGVGLIIIWQYIALNNRYFVEWSECLGALGELGRACKFSGALGRAGGLAGGRAS